jgi:hypothetical protein
MRENTDPDFKAVTLDAVFPAADGPGGLEGAMDRLCAAALAAIRDGARILIVSDRAADRDHAPIPMLLATAGLGHHLIRHGARTKPGWSLKAPSRARCIISRCFSAMARGRSTRTWRWRPSGNCRPRANSGTCPPTKRITAMKRR